MEDNRYCPECDSETTRCGAPNKPEQAICTNPECNWSGPWYKNTVTCEEFIDTLTLDDSWESPVSLQEYINSPECSGYHIEGEFLLVTIEGDEYIISDPDNADKKYRVSVEL